MRSPNCSWRWTLRRSTELRDRGLLASQLQDYASALRDLETWLRLAPAGEDERDERTQVWDHVKDLRRQMASLN